MKQSKSISASPYWTWIKTHPFKNPQGAMASEPVLANPDMLPEWPLKEQSEALDAILEVIDEGGEQVLSPREKKAFQLIVREGLSEREAAKRFRPRISRRAVVTYVRRASVKLRKLCQPKID